MAEVGEAARPTPCGLCGGGPLRPAFTTTDRNRGISSRAFRYERCERCGTYALANVPEDLEAYYPPEYYGRDDMALLEAAAAAPIEQGKLAMVRERVARGRLVEIGPGGGEFALAAARAGYEVTGLEMDAGACERLRHRVGVAAICSSEPDQALAALPTSDAIVLWHVLEHLPRPAAALAAAAENLRAGGVLALAVPNPDALQLRLLRGHWAHVDAPRHLFLIPLRVVVAQLEPLGLEMVASTCADPAGRHWNRFGWEYALRIHPARRSGGRLTRVGGGAIAALLAPLERSGLRGATYSGVFVKRG